MDGADSVCCVWFFIHAKCAALFSCEADFLGGNVVVVGLRVLCGALSCLCRPVYLCFKNWEKGSKV